MQRLATQHKKEPPAKRARFTKTGTQVMSMDVIVPSKKRKRSNAQLAIERKFLDTSLANQALVASTTYAGAELDPATVLCLTAPAQGDGGSNRDGRQIIGKSIQVKGQVFMLPIEDSMLQPPVVTKVHLALVLDTQTNNAQLNSEDVYTNPSANAGGNTFPVRNMDFAKRFKILKEQTFNFEDTNYDRSAANVFGQAGRSADFEWFIPLNDLRINFNATTTGVIGNVLDNSVHLIGNANQTGAGTGAPTITYNARFRFVG